MTVLRAFALYVLKPSALSFNVRTTSSPAALFSTLTYFISSKCSVNLPEMTSSSSNITSSAGTHENSSEFLASIPPINAPAPAMIRPVPRVEPISPTVAAAPIRPPALPTTSGDRSLDNLSLDFESTGNSIFDFPFSRMYSMDSSYPF